MKQFLLGLAAFLGLLKPTPTPPLATNTTNLPLTLAPGFSISIYATNLDNPRDLHPGTKGEILVSLPQAGKVMAIISGQNRTVLKNLNLPHGLAVNQDRLYVAETNRVSEYDYDTTTYTAKFIRKLTDLPAGGGHFTRSLLLVDNRTMLVSVGSSCNVCVESDSRRAAILTIDLPSSEIASF